MSVKYLGRRAVSRSVGETVSESVGKSMSHSVNAAMVHCLLAHGPSALVPSFRILLPSNSSDIEKHINMNLCHVSCEYSYIAKKYVEMYLCAHKKERNNRNVCMYCLIG